MLIDLFKKSELSSLTKVELSSELIDDFFWELSLVDLDVLDVLASIELDLEDADWLLLHLSSLLAEVVHLLSRLWALLNRRSIVASSAGASGAWLLVALVSSCSWLVLSKAIRWILWALWSIWVSSWHVSVFIDHLLRGSGSGVSLAHWGSRWLLQAAELIGSWSKSSWRSLLLLSWVEWSLGLSLGLRVLGLSELLGLRGEWVLLNWRCLLHWSLHHWLRSIHWLLLLNWSLLRNLSLDWLLLLWVSLGRDRSLGSSLSLWSHLSLWLVVNWFLLGELSGHLLLLRVWGESVLINWSLSGILWIKSSLLIGRLDRDELLSLLKIGGSLSVVVHVSEFIMDLLDLRVGQAVRFSVNQTLDSRKLVNQDKLWVISVVVDSIEISLEELLIQEVAVSLVDRHVEDGTADLEKILHDVFLISSELFQIGLNQKILLGLLEECIKLLVLLFQILVGIEEVKSLHDVDEV